MFDAGLDIGILVFILVGPLVFTRDGAPRRPKGTEVAKSPLRPVDALVGAEVGTLVSGTLVAFGFVDVALVLKSGLCTVGAEVDNASVSKSDAEVVSVVILRTFVSDGVALASANDSALVLKVDLCTLVFTFNIVAVVVISSLCTLASGNKFSADLTAEMLCFDLSFHLLQ